MTAFVWSFSVVAEEALDRLGWDGAVAPSIWPLEVADGLLSAERRGRITHGELPRLRSLILGLGVTIESVDLVAALGEILELAGRHQLTAYDAAYLRLALQHGSELASVDARLRRACVESGITLVG